MSFRCMHKKLFNYTYQPFTLSYFYEWLAVVPGVARGIFFLRIWIKNYSIFEKFKNCVEDFFSYI